MNKIECWILLSSDVLCNRYTSYTIWTGLTNRILTIKRAPGDYMAIFEAAHNGGEGEQTLKERPAGADWLGFCL